MRKYVIFKVKNEPRGKEFDTAREDTCDPATVLFRGAGNCHKGLFS
jgi:hypothetical protein